MPKDFAKRLVRMDCNAPSVDAERGGQRRAQGLHEVRPLALGADLLRLAAAVQVKNLKKQNFETGFSLHRLKG